jgi:ABC-2 type transport system ATP-binding protein
LGDLDAAAQACRALAAVQAASVGDRVIQLIVDGARTVLPELLRTVADSGVMVSSVDVNEPDLEAVFLHLTGKGLRD